MPSRWKDVIESPLFDPTYFAKDDPRTPAWAPDDAEEFCSEPANFSIATSKDFDAQAYREAYPDCAEFGLHPVVHFLEFGPSEGRHRFPVIATTDYSDRTDVALLAESHSLDYTGAPMEMRRLLRALKLDPASTFVTAPVGGPLQAAWHADGFQTLIHGFSERRIRSPADLKIMSRSAAKILASVRPAGIFINSLMAFPMACAAQSIGQPYVWVIHEPTADGLLDRFSPDVHDMVFAAMQRAHSLVFVSHASQASFAPYLDQRQNQHVIAKKLPPSPKISPSERDIFRAEFGLGVDDMLCLSVGTFSPRKDQMTLVKALAKVPKGQDRMTCLAVGASSADYSAAVEAQAQAVDPAICRLKIIAQSTTPDQRHAVQRMFAAADVVLVTSGAESSPLTVSEAFAAGCPVICADVAGVHDEVDDQVNGLLYPAGDPAALANRIAQVRDDTQLRERLRAGARASAHSKKDHDRMLDHYATIMQTAFSKDIWS